MAVLYEGRVYGAASKYEGEADCELLIDLLSQGKDVSSFCAAKRIGRPTFDAWREVHPEFDEALLIGKQAGQEFWENWMLDCLISGTVVNEGAWRFMMKNRYNYTDTRKLQMKGIRMAKSANEKAEVVSDHIDKGKLTSGEAKTMIEVVKTMAEIDMSTDAIQRLEAIEGLINAKK